MFWNSLSFHNKLLQNELRPPGYSTSAVGTAEETVPPPVELAISGAAVLVLAEATADSRFVSLNLRLESGGVSGPPGDSMPLAFTMLVVWAAGVDCCFFFASAAAVVRRLLRMACWMRVSRLSRASSWD